MGKGQINNLYAVRSLTFCPFVLVLAFYVERVAVKIIEKTGMDQKALKMLSREITNMDTVRHPAIVR